MFGDVATHSATVDDEPQLSAGALLADEISWTLSMMVELDRPIDELTAYLRACAERLRECEPGPLLIELLELLSGPQIPSDAFVDEAVLGAWDRVRAWTESRFYTAALPFIERDEYGSRVEAVRCALGLSRQGATNVLLIARRLAETFPATMDQLRAGQITHKHVWALFETTRMLSEDEAVAVEAATRAEAPEQTVADYRRALDKARAVAVPDFADRQAKSRVTGRGVSRWTDREGQPKLLANLPAEDLAAAWEALTRRADASRLPDDPRGHAARMADALTEALTGQPAAYDPRREPETPTTPGSEFEQAFPEPAPTAEPESTPAPSPEPPTTPPTSAPTGDLVEIHVVVPVATLTGGTMPATCDLPVANRKTRRAARRPRKGPARRGRVLTSKSFAVIGIDSLLGRTNLPGELSGNGWVPAATIRRLAQGNVLLRRLVVDSAGRLLDAEFTLELPAGMAPDATTEAALLAAPYRADALDYGVTVYRMPAELGRFIALRDRTCQIPGCSQAAWRCDCDHAIPFPRGSTSAANCGALCRRHHRLKTLAGWTLVRTGDGHSVWTSPAGHSVLRRPFSYLRYLS